MKKTVLEKDGKYKKAQRLKTAVTVTIYTLALSIGLSAAAFALFNKLKKMIGELPTETPIETVTPTESIEPNETPTESIIPTETPIESTEPTETASPIPTNPFSTPTPTPQSFAEYMQEQQYNESTDLYGMPIIWQIKLDGELKSISVVKLYDLKQQNFYIDFFSGTPIIYKYFDENLQKYIYQGIGPFKNKMIEMVRMIFMDKDDMKQVYGIVGFDLTKYKTIGELRKFYEKEIPKEQQVEQLLCFPDIGQDDILEWDSKYEEYYNQYFTSINYTTNVTLSASSKESLNNKLIASGLLKQDSNTNIVDYQKILQKRA